jgi:hypothetical protein
MYMYMGAFEMCQLIPRPVGKTITPERLRQGGTGFLIWNEFFICNKTTSLCHSHRAA